MNMNEMNNEMDAFVKKLSGVKDSDGGMVKLAYATSPGAFNTNYKAYQNSFLTLGDMQIPEDYRDIFKWCRYFFKFDSLIGPTIRSLATFPITEYVINDTEEFEKSEAENNSKDDKRSDTYNFYNNLFDKINLKNFLIEIGYDYHLYGNCIILAEPGVEEVRYRDKETGEIKTKKEVTWKSVRRLDVSLIRKDRDPNTQEINYYYIIPDDIRQVIRTKKPKKKYDAIPKIYKDAVEKNVPIKLNSEYIYDFSMPSESGDSGLWATPPIMHVMKLILYMNVLRQAQEAIAHEHIVPRRIYYFPETQDMTAADNFEKITEDFTQQLARQLNDPNYQIVSPLPIQEIQHGGQGRNLLLVPEIEQIQKNILAGMRVPYEFVFGGMSYSGSTTSLRILENTFITYRALLTEFVNEFLVKRLAKIRGEWEVAEDNDKLVTLEFSDLKMQDDIQQKELMVRLNQAEKLPDEVLYEKVFGLESAVVKKQLVNEKLEEIRAQAHMQMEQVAMQQQMEQQMAQMGIDPSEMQSGEEGGEEGEEGGEEQAQPEEEQAEQPQEEQAETPKEQVVNQQGPGKLSPEQLLQQLPGNLTPDDLTPEGKLTHKGAQKVAMDLAAQGEDVVAQVLKMLDYDSQTLVKTFIQLLHDQREGETDMRPLPEKLPPRRQGGV